MPSTAAHPSVSRHWVSLRMRADSRCSPRVPGADIGTTALRREARSRPTVGGSGRSLDRPMGESAECLEMILAEVHHVGAVRG
jgi:hypothetical protein